jgi:hypothetical protein
MRRSVERWRNGTADPGCSLFSLERATIPGLRRTTFALRRARETSRNGAVYFQPASLSQAAISAGCVFSQAVTERVSSDDILPFMHEQ